MNWIDIFSLVCILILTAIGIYRGFLKGLFRLIAWAASIIGAYMSQDILAGVISRNLEISGFTVTLVCICLGFLIPFITLFAIGHFVEKSIEDTSIGKVNRIFGGIIGAFKGWLICCILLTILHILPITGNLKETRNEAIAYSLYKFNIELIGFSSEEVDLVAIAERKASEISKEIADKAVEKAKETTEEVADKAKEAATKAVKETISEGADSLKKKVTNDKN